MRISKTNLFRLIIICTGILFLVLSYLCFIYVIPGFEICGSGCDYWWTWIFKFHHRKTCLEMCISRNELYKPFMVIGGGLIIFEMIFEIINVLRSFLRKS